MLSLARFLQEPAAAPEERCEICAVKIGGEHGHLADLRDRRLLCACRPCYLLFVPRGAAQGRYRAVGDRFARIDEQIFSGERWEALQIPIGLAFFFYDSPAERVIAFYPGAGGATESTLPLGAWEELAHEEPLLAGMEPDIEATLVYRRKHGASQAYIVPIDVCYELVAIVRNAWQGFDGGDAAHENIERFFSRIAERSA